MYRYKLRRIEHGSEKYGVCEVCGKPMHKVSFHQIEERKYTIRPGVSGWVYLIEGDRIGHKTCLMKKRRNRK